MNNASTRARILCIEDELSLLADLQEELQAAGYEVRGAASAEQARQARQHLLGLGLPRKSFTAAAYWGQAANPA